LIYQVEHVIKTLEDASEMRQSSITLKPSEQTQLGEVGHRGLNFRSKVRVRALIGKASHSFVIVVWFS